MDPGVKVLVRLIIGDAGRASVTRVTRQLRVRAIRTFRRPRLYREKPQPRKGLGHLSAKVRARQCAVRVVRFGREPRPLTLRTGAAKSEGRAQDAQKSWAAETRRRPNLWGLDVQSSGKSGDSVETALQSSIQMNSQPLQGRVANQREDARTQRQRECAQVQRIVRQVHRNE